MVDPRLSLAMSDGRVPYFKYHVDHVDANKLEGALNEINDCNETLIMDVVLESRSHKNGQASYCIIYVKLRPAPPVTGGPTEPSIIKMPGAPSATATPSHLEDIDDTEP